VNIWLRPTPRTANPTITEIERTVTFLLSLNGMRMATNPYLQIGDSLRSRKEDAGGAQPSRRIDENEAGIWQDAGIANDPIMQVHVGSPHNRVGATGFEPATSCSRSRRATGLRYAPKKTSIVVRTHILTDKRSLREEFPINNADCNAPCKSPRIVDLPHICDTPKLLTAKSLGLHEGGDSTAVFCVAECLGIASLR
jgi:hypothetical protein